jgi:hypothetical protein
MTTRRLYFALFVAGAVIPMAAFVPWFAVHGLDTRLFVRQLFANRISTFFALDLLLTAVVVLQMARRERGKLRLWWLPILATLFIGVSAGLPLLLYLRERSRV